MTEKVPGYRILKFPKTRIATNDVCSVGLEKHHIPALLEIDVTQSREKLRVYKRNKGRISFTAWLIKTIAITIRDYELVAAYHSGKRKLVVFSDINVGLAVEKKINGERVPMPLLIEKAQERSLESITLQINEARNQEILEKDVVLHRKSTVTERFYFMLPGFLRRAIWRFMLKRPRMAFARMGNVAVTSVGMIGRANGWFIPISVHPACFGIGKTSKKPVVVDDKIEIREILNLTVLLDHDVVDGALMARFISALINNIEKGTGLKIQEK
jgi:pyruvate/2-oxoglutarate dehydrogenase complex dihydrolipoamide acyltransferase (E2) component